MLSPDSLEEAILDDCRVDECEVAPKLLSVKSLTTWNEGDGDVRDTMTSKDDLDSRFRASLHRSVVPVVAYRIWDLLYQTVKILEYRLMMRMVVWRTTGVHMERWYGVIWAKKVSMYVQKAEADDVVTKTDECVVAWSLSDDPLSSLTSSIISHWSPIVSEGGSGTSSHASVSSYS